MSYFISALLVCSVFSCGPSTFSSEVSPLCLVLLWADLLGSPCESVVQRRSQYSEEARSRCVSELEARAEESEPTATPTSSRGRWGKAAYLRIDCNSRLISYRDPFLHMAD